MKRYQGYLIDLDGTVYRGNEVIPEAVKFINELRRADIPFLYLTNNSSASAGAIADRLINMGLQTRTEEIYTSSMATAAYLSKHAPNGGSVYVIGEQGLINELNNAGFTLSEKDPDYVVVGIDRQFTYEKLSIATRAVRGGATLIATNKDAALPTEQGFLPGNGSLVAAVSTAAGVDPLVIGKPEKIIVQLGMERLHTSASETLIVGDNLFTDIEAGANSGLDSLLVLTGYSSAEDAANHPRKPTYIVRDLWEWWERQQR